MFKQLLEFCGNLVENVYLFLYQFVVSNRCFVIVNSTIIALNLGLMFVVRGYMSRKNKEGNETLKMFKDMRLSLVKQKNHHSVLSLCSSLKFVDSHSTSAKPDSKTTTDCKSTKSPPETFCKPNKTSSPHHDIMTAHEDGQQPALDKTLANYEKCDETLDEITWGGEDSMSAGIDRDNVKNHHVLDKALQDETLSEIIRGHSSCMIAKSDLRLQQGNRDDGSDLHVEKEKQCRSKVQEKTHVSEATKNELIHGSSRSGVRNKSDKKVPKEAHQWDGNKDKQSQGARQERHMDGSVKQEKMTIFLRHHERSPTETDRKWTQRKRQDARKAKIRKREKLRTPVELAHSSDADSGNSPDTLGPDFGWSDQHLHGPRSESSLVYKRDSWIWFSPEMRPSVENFASRQRKFKSRDPRVAELAEEISRQEKMNRDIERAAESLIDNSSSSPSRVGEASLRCLCPEARQRRAYGALKRMAGRKHRMKPYTRPDRRGTATSPPPTSSRVSGDIFKRKHSALNAGSSSLRSSPLLKQARLTSMSPDICGYSSKTPSPRDRKEEGQKGLEHRENSPVRLSPSLQLNYMRSTAESSPSSDHSKHSVRRPISLVTSSPPHSVYYYNPTAAKIIRRSPTSGRYSSLYDNTTLISSTHSLACSAESHEVHASKATLGQERSRHNTPEALGGRSHRPASPHRKHCPSRVSRICSPGKAETHKQRFSRSPRLQSPKGSIYPEPKSQSPAKVRAKTNINLDTMREKHPQKPKFSKSPKASSPKTKRACDRGAVKANRLSSGTRYDGVKAFRKSPPITLSTGESESDSVQRDKSTGLDTSYMQGLISKEVNTAVHRLLFDTEKSSSSHSPSTKSKIPYPDVSANEEGNTANNQKCKVGTNDSQLLPTPGEERFTGMSPPESSQEDHERGSEDSANQMSLNESQNLENCDMVQSDLKLSDVSNAVTKTSICTQTKSQMCTKIYTPDYYLGKRVTSRKQKPIKTNFGTQREAIPSRWKKTDITWSKTVSLRLYSPLSKSTLPAPKRKMCKYGRQKLKPCLKSVRRSSQQPTKSRSHKEESQHERACPTTVPDGQLTMKESEAKKAVCSIKKYRLLPFSSSDPYEKMKVASTEGLNAFCSLNTHKKNLTLRKSCSQTVTPRKHDNQASRSAYTDKKPCSAANKAHSMKDGDPQSQTNKLDVTSSTNNSSSNVPYNSSGKSSSSDNPSMKAAQFYFVTQTQLSFQNTFSPTADCDYFKLLKSAPTEMFHQPHISPTKSCIFSKSNTQAANEEESREHHSKLKVAPLTRSHEASFQTQHLGIVSVEKINEMNLRNLVPLKFWPENDKGLGYKQESNCFMESNCVSGADHKDGLVHPSTSCEMLGALSPIIQLQQPPGSTAEKSDEKGQVRVCEQSRKPDNLNVAVSWTDVSGWVSLPTTPWSLLVRNSSNLDSGYEESLSDKAHFDGHLQPSATGSVDQTVTRTSPAWSKILSSDVQQHHSTCKAAASSSHTSHTSYLAHMSRLSAEWDTKLDSMPSRIQ